MALNLPVASGELPERLALVVDRVDLAVEQRVLQRPEGQVVLVVAAQPQLRRVVQRRKHLGLVVPVVRIGELDELDVVDRHAVHAQHELDAGVLLDAPPVVLDGVQALREADLLALELLHPEDVVPGAHQHHAALVHLRRPQQHGPADVGVDGIGGYRPPKRTRLSRLWT